LTRVLASDKLDSMEKGLGQNPKIITKEVFKGTTSDGFYCDYCGSRLEVWFDDSWDEIAGFRMLPVPWCPNCNMRVKRIDKDGE
jgi:DNA-directed RNA polymerase subunit RPC12/RpoP